MKISVTRLSRLTLLAALATACSKEELAPASPAVAASTRAAAEADNLAMGNPSGAEADAINSPNNYLIVKDQYTISYSRDRGKPNWVSWHLSSDWLGGSDRQDNFAADVTLPKGWYRVGSTSYRGSGFDRGHVCPSADRTCSAADNSATFLMTNMMPQAPTNNQRTWAGLETYARTLVNQGNEVYLIAGSYGQGGTGSNGYATTIDKGRITVPSNCWKVLVVLPEGGDASSVTTSTRVIAVDMPNNNSISTAWGSYRTSVDAIEEATGYDILSAVSEEVQDLIEAQVDRGPTS
ncbi:DNA/RNA non-specific endonuclease [Hymenobacter sp. BT664]|uniref:DNA/RNA non-specific endonuclease n=1 Tax=Hymenobacter montanus TaxID=2771359 RepID=A0A927BC89_9BACT|nr:DNA/RNA non-specific endonuclease [Hymenobacter montanus]MBD2767494.1 DNA/RNA non-specific endonuclease [Hymenobacter montanus]